MLWRWATQGVQDQLDAATMALLVGMNTLGGLTFLVKGFVRIPPVPLLLGSSALIVASQLLV